MSNHQASALAASSPQGPPKDLSAAWGSTKLRSHHLERAAIVYVRQSSAQQVFENQESTARQYALVDRATALGWTPEYVQVIDDDQGQSGATAEGRLGFQRLLAEVGLDHVGIVLGIEMSRLARSNKDWHQLIELCAIFRTLLADQDGLYDPTDYNDRLLLGLKGTMSEAELHILQGRMYQAVLNKARRGELFQLPPVGYVKLPTGEFAIDPDEQVQSVVRLIFDEFNRQGTVRGVIRYLMQNDIKVPIRPNTSRERIEWRQPTRESIATVLMHPIYAGTYRYGYRQTDPRRKKPGKPGSGRVVMKPEDYHALLPNHCPAYITIECYERNQRRIADNRARAVSKGAPRKGSSLLGGLLFCGRCQLRMTVHYSGKPASLRYVCRHEKNDCRGPFCQSMSGQVLDDLVTEKIMAALEPAALELSLGAIGDLQQEQDRLEQHWQQQLERARYQAERIERQYQAVEPENRLVGRELERRWETALREAQEMQKEYARFRQSRPATLSAKEREAILALSRNLPVLWNAPTTTPADRQRIVRLLVERVVVHIQGESDHTDVTLHWAGGFTSQHGLVRPVLRCDQMADYERLMGRITELRSQGLSFAAIAKQLNREGFRPVKQAKKFHSDIVSRMVRRHENRPPGSKSKALARVLREHEWFAVDLITELKMSKNTLFSWIKQGWVHVTRQLPGYRGRMILWADAKELDRLRRLRQTRHGWWDPPLPADLTTPRPVDPK
jgi:DNA invertase Pin-like site-specific DNA recombinase